MENYEELKKRFIEAKELEREAKTIEAEVAEMVENEVLKHLYKGSKTEALRVINEVYSDEDGENGSAEWFLYFQKKIYQYM